MSKSNITKASSFIVFAGFMAMAMGLGGCVAETDDVDENEGAKEGIEEVDPGLDPTGISINPPLVEDWVSYSAATTSSVTTGYATYTFTIPSYFTHERVRVSTNTQCLGGHPPPAIPSFVSSKTV